MRPRPSTVVISQVPDVCIPQPAVCGRGLSPHGMTDTPIASFRCDPAQSQRFPVELCTNGAQPGNAWLAATARRSWVVARGDGVSGVRQCRLRVRRIAL